MNSPDQMPGAGYVDVNGIRVHVAELRKISSDIRRFLDYLPKAQELCRHPAHSPEWVAVVESAADIESLLTTVRELGAFNRAEADFLRAEAARRETAREGQV